MFNDKGIKPVLTRPQLWGLLLFLAVLVSVTDVAALNDPTRPPARRSSTQSSGIVTAPTARLELTSILIAPERRVAVINGRSLQINERIGDYKVVDIQFDVVLVKNDNRLLPLTLKTGVVKKPVILPDRGQ